MEDRILKKIKKCLALSKSPEPAEAAAALRQAQKLMAKYGVSATDVAAADVGECYVASKVSVSRVKDWELRLVDLVAKAFGCELLWSKSSSKAADVFGKFMMIGLKDQLELAHYTCEVLQRKLLAARAKYNSTLPSYYSRRDKTQEADGFCHGWVDGIKKTVHEFALTPEQKELIHQHRDKLKGGSDAKVQRRDGSSIARSSGRSAAASESLYRPMHGQQQTYLGN